VFHIVYKSTHTATGRFYLGIHSTEDLADGYLGSGYALLRMVKKYGKPAFSREILRLELSRESAQEWEKTLVQEFISHPLCVNIAEGGTGGVKGHKRIHHPESLVEKTVSPELLPEFLENGWLSGLAKARTTGLVWIHKDSTRRRVQRDEVVALQEAGWLTGAGFNPADSTVWVHRDAERLRVDPIEAECLFAQGWLAGNGATHRQGQLWWHHPSGEKRSCPDRPGPDWLPGRGVLGSHKNKRRSHSS
jgi:hypothetical protein